MLKIYHQDSLRRVQNRRLGIAFALGLLAGLVLTVNGSRALIEVAYADAGARPASSPAASKPLQHPLSLKSSTTMSVSTPTVAR
ncbi:hypothetical protein [Polycyclovorans algicola]|uniref:hypothetical protein n=1 Tax=Polycyclovorans algicola TaxID=616992 RepID=UPI0004A6A918|nr:hypothetical protein [Polycyclovorans algicola]